MNFHAVRRDFPSLSSYSDHELLHLESLKLSEFMSLSTSVSSLSTLVNLQELDLSYCCLRVINLSKLRLKKVYVIDCSLRRIILNPCVEILNIRNNHLDNYSFGVNGLDINNMTNLQELNASLNVLTTLDISLLNLKVLDLSINNLTHIGLNCPNLDILNISHNNLKLIKLKTPILKELNLACNSTLSNKVKLPSSLEQLSLYGNSLTTVPKTIANLPLTYLNLSDNLLTTIPESITKLPLDFLDVSDNSLTTLPDFVNSSLEFLIVSYNKLTTLPKFSKSFHYIDLSGVRINKISNRDLYIPNVAGGYMTKKIQQHSIKRQKEYGWLICKRKLRLDIFHEYILRYLDDHKFDDIDPEDESDIDIDLEDSDTD